MTYAHDAVCERCGFDPRRWTREDALRTLAAADALVDVTTAGLDLPGAGALADVLGELEAAGSVAVDRSMDSTTLRAAAHRVMHGLTELAEQRAVLEHAAGTAIHQVGRVEQVSSSGGGVPKSPVARAEIDVGGVVGDRQATRVHHGRQWQAVCLYSAEVIDALRAEGHPIHAGAAGENLTLGGVDWSTLRGGLLVDIGAVRLRLSAPAVPCAKNDRWFADGDSRRIHHDLHPGWGRWYASVLHGGTVAPGDGVVVHDG